MSSDTGNAHISNLRDGAGSAGISLSAEARSLSQAVQDPSRTVVDRISAYEDIINLEVGDTSLTRARNIEREAGIRQIYLKFEGGNPTGTQKDRIAFAQCLDALRRGYEEITLATCGNYGASVALAARLAGIRCMVCIPENYHTQRIVDIEGEGAEIIRNGSSYEHSVEYSQELARKREYYDANPGGKNTSLQLQAYGEVANEIYDVLRDAPRVVAVPVSNGTLMAGVYRGFVSLYKRGKTSRLPRMLASSSTNKNPIISSFNKGLKHCEILDPVRIKETSLNEPLINWRSFDGDEALQALIDSQGMVYSVSDSKLAANSKLLREKEGLNVLPASTAGLIGLLEIHKQLPFEGDRYVAILTGRK